MPSFDEKKAYVEQEETFFDDGREIELLHYIYGRSDIDELRGSPERVLQAIDEFGRTKKYLMNVGEDKGKILTDLIAEVKPKVMVELGGYVGYSTLLFANAVRKSGGTHYFSLERNPEFAAVITSLLDLSGLRDIARVMVGPSDAGLARLHANGTISKIDLMFLDHYKPAYTSDLKLCERLGLVGPGSVLAADNVIKPGNPPYLAYVRSSVAEKRVAKGGNEKDGFVDRTAKQYLQREGEERINEEEGDPNLVYESKLVHSFEPTGVPASLPIPPPPLVSLTILGRCRDYKMYRFEPHDSIVVFKPRNPHLPNPWAGKYMEPERIGPTDRESAKPRRPLEKGYHSECVHLVAKGLPFGDSVHRAIKDRTGYGIGYSELLPSTESARVYRLTKMFAQEFMPIVGYRLPLEICEYLINGVWSNKDFVGPQHATLRVTNSCSVWAQHVEFEGLQYIKSLSATRKSESDTKLFEATCDRVNVYFAEDCLGIRDVVITEYDNTPSLNQDKDLRWVGLKLRDLAMTKMEDAEAYYRRRRWAVLPNDLNISRLAPPQPECNFEVSNEPIRAVDWNLPGCCGYSVLIGRPYSQLADVSNEHKGDWFYVPLDREERIAELWRRIEDHGNMWYCYNTLIMRTNRGRSFVLGHRISGRARKVTCRPITTLSPTDSSRMLYCKTKQLKFWLGFERVKTWERHAICIPYPNPPTPTPFLLKQLLSSNAELRDVKAVAVCRNWRYSKDVGIVGMLLTYADGHQRSLGQLRLDYMEPPLTVSSDKIWLGSDKSENEPIPEGFWLSANKIKWFEATLNGKATRSGAVGST
ncbi:catechol O-methyltransferase [Fusarium agapanthi]|uniref:catechol O-methyltransferase n=1 Tax=Fusarium agapanthi TaxID=1803897 RepID=A0A9P5BAF6_9HYPO|nr:catechol O-methyltransferase [Fusarium agapanthi]